MEMAFNGRIRGLNKRNTGDQQTPVFSITVTRGPCGSILKTAVRTGFPGRQVSFGGHMQRRVTNVSAHGSFTVALLVTGHLRNAASNTGDKGDGGVEEEATVDDRASLKANREPRECASSTII